MHRRGGDRVVLVFPAAVGLLQSLSSMAVLLQCAFCGPLDKSLPDHVHFCKASLASLVRQALCAHTLQPWLPFGESPRPFARSRIGEGQQ